MAQAWPIGVPEWALAGSIQEQVEDNRSEFQPEVGMPIRRRRTSIAVALLSFTTVMTPAQYTTLADWYKNTLNDGTDSFTRKHPRTQSQTTFVFISPPSAQETSLGAYTVAFELREQP